jgi:hypothetical protein
VNSKGSRRITRPSAADGCQLELGHAIKGAGRRKMPAAESPTRTASRRDGETESPDTDAAGGLDGAHVVLDALGAGSRDETVAERLRGFVTRAAGERAAAALDPDFGTALARYHLQHSGHPDGCPCNPCRQARVMR